MDYLAAKKLREEWGNKPCEHPSFEKETHKDPEGFDVSDVTDYDCTQCGANFTRDEVERIKKEREHGNEKF